MANEIDLVVGEVAFQKITELIKRLGDVDIAFGEIATKFSNLGKGANPQSTAELEKLTAENQKLNKALNDLKASYTTIDTELAKNTPDAAKVALLKATIIELTSTPEAIGFAVVRSQGITEGQWISFDSHINQEKVIQDSDFYQDYSYQLIVDVEPNKYEDIYRSIMHPAGIKLFTTFGQTSFINIDIDFVASEIISFVQSDFNITSEDESEFIVSEESDSLYLVTRVFEV